MARRVSTTFQIAHGDAARDTDVNSRPTEIPAMDFYSNHFILNWLVSGLAVLLTSKLVAGFEIRGFFTACIAALLIGLANAVIWPILIFITLPINILTLGLFTFVVNGAVLKICAAVLSGFELRSWLSAIFGSIVLALTNMFLHYVLW